MARTSSDAAFLRLAGCSTGSYLLIAIFGGQGFISGEGAYSIAAENDEEALAGAVKQVGALVENGNLLRTYLLLSPRGELVVRQ